MANKRTVLAAVVTLCFLLGLAQSVEAQVLNASIPQDDRGVQQAAGNLDDTELSQGIRQVGWPSVSLPKITMPKITMPKITMPKITMPKFPPLWPTGKEDEPSALLAPVASGFAKVSAGTKKAWEGTKEIFSVTKADSATSSAIPAAQPEPSFWQRLVGKPPEPKGPETIGEFMSQKRLNP